MFGPLAHLLTLAAACGLLGGCSRTVPVHPPSPVAIEVPVEAPSSVSPIPNTSSSPSPSPTPTLNPTPNPPTPTPTPYTSPIPILVYHHVREQEGWSKETWSWKMTVSPDVFERHMAWLTERGYTTIDLDTYVAMRKGERTGPLKPVIITFDDNNLNQYDTALPIMETYAHKAVFYLIAKHLDSPVMINRERAADLARRGMDIQSHTMTHAMMTNLSAADIEWQLAESKRLLEEISGKPVHHVAYPLTAHNAFVREQTEKAGYVTGTIMDPRNARADDSLFKLPRIMMTDDTNLEKVLP